MRDRLHIPALALSLLAVLLLALSGCATKNPAEGATVSGEVQFLDSFSFDRKLSASLGAGQPQVDVLFPAVITLNNIPERMDKWLSKVEKFGGKVEIPTDGQSPHVWDGDALIIAILPHGAKVAIHDVSLATGAYPVPGRC